VEKVSVTVKNYFTYAGFEGLLCYCTAYLCGYFAFRTFSKAFRRGRYKGYPGKVVDELNIDLLIATENTHAWTLSRSRNLSADAGFDFISSLNLAYHDFFVFAGFTLLSSTSDWFELI